MVKEGAVAVSARHLYDIVRALPESRRSRCKRAQNNYLEVSSGPSEFQHRRPARRGLPGAARASRRSPSPTSTPTSCSSMIERTFFAVSNDETRYNLNGVYFEPAGRGCCAWWPPTATASRCPRSRIAGDFGLKRGVILPQEGAPGAAQAALRGGRVGRGEAGAKLGFVENSGDLRAARASSWSMRLIEGLFPDYKQVIPKPGEKVVKIGRERFLETLRRVSLLSTDKAHAVKLELSKGTLRVLSQNPDLGEAKEDVPVEYARRAAQDRLQRPLPHSTCWRCSRSKDVQLELADDLSPGVLQRRRRGRTRASPRW